MELSYKSFYIAVSSMKEKNIGSSCFRFTDIVHIKITMVICLPVWLHVMVLFLVLQYMHGI